MEVSDHVPHRTTYGQNNSWVVHEIPAEWLPVRWKTKRPAKAIGWDCRACARNVCQEHSEVNISSTCKVGQKLGVSLPLLTCSPSAWPSRLLYRRGRKSWRDLWITLYFNLLILQYPYTLISFNLLWSPYTSYSLHLHLLILQYPYTLISFNLLWSPYTSYSLHLHLLIL